MTAFRDSRLSANRPLLRDVAPATAAPLGATRGPGGNATRADHLRFESVLFFRTADREASPHSSAPECFRDLNLDQIVDTVVTGQELYSLKPFFYTALRDADAIQYRHEVFRDLEDGSLSEHIRSFTKCLREIAELLTQGNKLFYEFQKEAWLIDAVEMYGNAIQQLASDLTKAHLSSRGLRGFRAYLARYVRCETFTSLKNETARLKRDLSKVHYSVLIRDNALTVNPYEGELDYSDQILKVFKKFEQGATKDYRVKFGARVEMNHIEAKIIEFVALLHPELFSRLRDFRARHADFIDSIIATFNREVQFYLAYADHMIRLQTGGLQFCYPRVEAGSKEVYARGAFDMALAHKLNHDGVPIVCNDFYLRGDERVIVVSGPNQGGKTTFARMFGQLHYLARLGCPVPAHHAQLLLYDRIFTHFEREEKVENLRGKLETDLTRIRSILDDATSQSIVVLNEVFTSTALQDETFLSRKIMEALMARDVLCVWVTFVDELASFDQHTVSMVSKVMPENPALRTFKVIRQRADGLAYALAIAEKYGLTRHRITQRIRS